MDRGLLPASIGMLLLTALLVILSSVAWRSQTVFAGTTMESSTGGCSLKESGKSWLLRNNWIEVEISKETGQLLSIMRNGKSILSGRASAVFKDRIDSRSFVDGDAKVTAAEVESSPKAVHLLLKKDFGGGYPATITFTLDDRALRWDVEVSTVTSPDREANIDFCFPILGQMEEAFWTADGAPFRLAELPSCKITYRSGMVLPSVALYNPGLDFGLTFVAPFDLPKPGLSFRFEGDCFTVSNFYLRMGKDKPARAAVCIVPHEGDWRPGLAWMLETYPDYFRPVARRVLEGEGLYAMGFTGTSEDQIRSFAEQGVTWQEFHCHFPFYGLYVPDREEWPLIIDQDKISLAEWESGDLPGVSKNSLRRMKELIDLWHRYGIQVYLYFQSFEAWHQYAEKYFPEDIARNATGQPHGAWPLCNLMNPDPSTAWGKHILQQLKKVLEVYPDIDGIFYDRDDYWNYDFSHDDGITMQGYRPCYMLAFAQEKINQEIAELLHSRGMGIWTNGPTSVEVTRAIDGIMAEANRPWAQVLQYLGLVRPMICLPYDRDPQGTESKLKTCLSCGYFPSVTSGGFESRLIEEKYKPLFALMKGREWVLNAHALKLPPGMEGNIFRSPQGDYLVSVVSPGASQVPSGSARSAFSFDVPLEIRVPDANEITSCYVLSGDYRGVGKVAFHLEGEVIKVRIPAHLASALVLLSKEPRFEVTRLSSPVLIRGERNELAIGLENLGDSPKDCPVTLWTPWGEKQENVKLDPGASIEVKMEVPVPQDARKGETLVPLRVDVGEKSTIMTAWVQDAVEISGPGRIFIKETAGEDVRFWATNYTERELRVKLDGRFEGGTGKVSLPVELVIGPHESREFVCNIVPEVERGNVEIQAQSDGKVMYAEFPVESSMRFAADDLFHDDFASGTMDDNKWKVLRGSWNVENGIAGGSGGSHFAVAGERDWKDYAIEVTTSIAGSSDPNIGWLKSYLFARVQDMGNFYRFGIHGDAGVIDLYKCVNGEWILLGTYPFNPEKNRWYTLKLEVSGSHIRGYIDGQPVIEARDDTFPSGGIGIGVLEDSMVTFYRNVVVKAIE